MSLTSQRDRQNASPSVALFSALIRAFEPRPDGRRCFESCTPLTAADYKESNTLRLPPPPYFANFVGCVPLFSLRRMAQKIPVFLVCLVSVHLREILRMEPKREHKTPHSARLRFFCRQPLARLACRPPDRLDTAGRADYSRAGLTRCEAKARSAAPWTHAARRRRIAPRSRGKSPKDQRPGRGVGGCQWLRAFGSDTFAGFL